MKKRSLGPAFKDEFDKVAVKSGHFKSSGPMEWKDSLIPNFDFKLNNERVSPWIIVGFLSICIILFFALFVRLFHLQVVKGSENRQRADENRIQIKVIHAPRGVIFDRNGKILASNEPGFRLFENGQVTQISRDEALKMEVNEDLRFSSLEIDNVRSYPNGEKFAHVLGFVGQISESELNDPKFKGYRTGDKIGRGGVEQSYEKFLRGIDGGEVIEVDSLGQKLRTLREIKATPGKNLYLTLDSDLQIFIFETLSQTLKKSNSCCGAAVVEDPTNGAILALVSLPSFNPSQPDLFINGSNSPILNRAIAGLYPPGSTFKIVSALAALNSGKISPSQTFEDTGQIFLGTFKFSNWYFNQYGKVEGSVDLKKALQRSNDTYFYRVGEILGEKALGEMAKTLGLGRVADLDIPGAMAGLVPDNDWKLKEVGDVWFPGDTLHMAIGQGFLLTTPLQVSNLTSFVASGGGLVQSHLALKITEADGKVVKEFQFEKVLEKRIKDIEIVKEGLALVPKNGGTAWPLFTFPIDSAGKTGTAEYGDSKNRTHAWYSGFAPLNDPKITATVLVEGGGEGSTVASPVVKEIFRWFLSEDKKNLIKDNVPISTESARQLGE